MLFYFVNAIQSSNLFVMSTINEYETTAKSRTDTRCEMDKMREILTSIASEMQRFHDSTIESDSEVENPGNREKQNVFGELLKCKSKINSKRVFIKKLRKNLETACSVAKIVASANEIGYHKQLSGSAQSEFKDMEKFQNNNIEINNLKKENLILNNKLNNIANFIRLGYEELQKIREEPADEKSIFEQLRKLIICCGQYYADYCNEHDECLHLKQKISFLTNKSQILENNIDALSQQLKTLQYRNFRLQKENELNKDIINKSKHNDIELTNSQVEIKSNVQCISSDENIELEDEKEFKANENKLDFEVEFDLSPHLTKVKELLHCQDILLRDLKSLSDEFLNNNEK